MLFIPLYETPMIRAFPDGFNYPIPRGWPTPERGDQPYYVGPWDNEEEKDKWRGFRIVTQEVANADHNHGIAELIFDVHHLNTRLNCRFFDEPNTTEYDNLVKILGWPGFSRIDLSLLAEGQQDDGWASFRSSYLKRALSKATDLQHVSLRSQAEYLREPRSDADFVPFRTIFPIEIWHKLRHFGLSNFYVKQHDLVSLLASLPKSVRSVELGSLAFLSPEESYMSLFNAMRETLDWRDRPVNEQSTVTILADHPPKRNRVPLKYIWMRDAISDFLYGNATNPFREIWGTCGKPISISPTRAVGAD